MTLEYLDLADFLLIAEAVLDIPAEDLARAARLELAESALHAPAATFGGVEFYPDLARKTAVLAYRLINNHPLPDGNKPVGYLCALEFIARNGGTWTLGFPRVNGHREIRRHGSGYGLVPRCVGRACSAPSDDAWCCASGCSGRSRPALHAGSGTPRSGARARS